MLDEEHEPDEEYKRRTAEEAARALADLKDAIDAQSPNVLNDHELIDLGNFLKIVRNDYGNTVSPIESAIVSIACSYAASLEGGWGMTPDDIIHWVESSDGCRSFFDDAIQTARIFRKRYARRLDKDDTEVAA
jgi:hypothetical protein